MRYTAGRCWTPMAPLNSVAAIERVSAEKRAIFVDLLATVALAHAERELAMDLPHGGGDRRKSSGEDAAAGNEHAVSTSSSSKHVKAVVNRERRARPKTTEDTNSATPLVTEARC